VDKKTYNIAVDAYAGNLYRFLYKSLRDKDQANDLVQDSFVKLWENKDKIDPTKVKSWLFTTAHNLMINFLKKTGRYKPLDEPDMSRQQVHEESDYEVKELVDKSLDQLPHIQKAIIILKDLEGYNYKEIGDMLSLNESQVKVYLFRGRQKIKNLIKDTRTF
jgi:RNA polymerase sigma-70 factor (ECF subfamily)